ISRELATIHQHLPIQFEPAALELKQPDRQLALDLFAELGFRSFMQEFSQPQDDMAQEALIVGDGIETNVRRLLEHPDVYVRTAGEAACVMGDTGPPVFLDLRNASSEALWRQLAERQAVTKVCWDGKPLLQNFPGMKIDDIMLMAFLLAPHAGDYSLQRWSMEHLRISLSDDREEGKSLLDSAPGGAVGRRLSLEVEVLRRLHRLLAPQIDQLGLRRLYEEIELPLVPVLAEMELTGIRLRPETLRHLSEGMEGELEQLTKKIYGAAGTEFNINSPKQLGEILFEKLNLPTVKKTRKTKGYSTDQSVLEELAQSYELPRLILEYRQIAKLKSTYIDTLPRLMDPLTCRVHTSFNQTGAATGRLSSSEPNLQNIPVRTELGRRIRGAFVPDRGSLFVSADYSQVELRVLAHLSRDDVLLDAFRTNQDIHERTAIEVFGEADPSSRAEWRRRAKVINFGIVYGLSAFGMAQRLGIGREEAQAFIDAYFERYRGVRKWLDLTIEEARREGLVRTMFGRIRPIPEIRAKDYPTRQFAERVAVNSPIQGTAADIIKIAMIRIQKSLRKNGLSSKILLQVHDELVLEAPEREVEQVQQIVRREMEGAAELAVPLRVDMGVADNWMDMK
ncbi:MAG: DNA polymerase I, partial [Acidobacteria bacterium]|nr:DNA polymerase I [Acidobacteriota bacterium]